MRVALVAASPLERAGLEAILAANDLVVAGSFADARDLVERLAELQPDAVLVALDTHEDEPPAEVFALAAAPSAPPVAVLAAHGSTVWAPDTLRAGVRAVLARDASAGEIASGLRAVANGLVVMHPETIENLVHELPVARGGGAPHPALTPRELDVLRMLAEGLGNKVISARLGISEHTVKFHLASIFAKLNAGSRTEAVTQGVRQGLILL